MCLSFQYAVLEFSEFDLERSDETGCVFDKVSIHDGPDPTAPVISSHCGQSLPVPVEGTTNQLYVVFTSDESIKRRGFKAVFAAKDPVHVGDEGKSTNDKGLNCKIQIFWVKKKKHKKSYQSAFLRLLQGVKIVIISCR